MIDETSAELMTGRIATRPVGVEPVILSRMRRG